MQDEKGLDEKIDLFVSEISFGDVAKVMGLVHVFENAEKCNCLFMSCFLCLLTFQMKMKFLWIKLVLKILLKWWVFICVWGRLKVQLFVDVCVFLCLSLLFQNCLKNEVPHYFFSQKIKRLIISSEKIEAPHYFFRKKRSASLFLQK